MRTWPYLLVMIAVVVGVDVLFLRHNVGLRLLVNIGIVALFIACYFVFLRK